MSETARAWKKVVALSGGVGGARLVHGLSRAVAPEALTVIVNTGDDFEHWGLSISPDVDTVMYTLADLAHEERGWGLATETFAALEGMRRYGEDDWFALGDRDLATHLARTRALRQGEPLHAITDRLCRALGIGARVVPMTDGPCKTMIDTPSHGTLTFQDWFVRHRAAPIASRVWFDGRPEAAPGVVAAIDEAELVVIGPSNPYVSIDPIISLPGVREAISRRKIVAVSPIVGGHAVKGPLAEMLRSIAGASPSAAAVARYYEGLIDGFVVENGDEAETFAVPVLATSTVMRTRALSLALAKATLAFAEGLVS